MDEYTTTEIARLHRMLDWAKENPNAGMCGTCCCPANATPENEGYSSCCNDRIEYDGERSESIRNWIKTLKEEN